MININHYSKLNHNRLYNNKNLVDKTDILKEFESDRGRIINSAAIRRLQQKTQVFPLERNAAVRSRLTHSLEVQQIGRYIVKEILSKLTQDQKQMLGIEGLESGLESIVEMACLMHDIGNPPFGHFGEAAINHWFRKKLEYSENEDFTPYKAIKFVKNDSVGNEIKRKIRQCLMNFEGNAQGIRIIHTLQKLNLTYAQIGAVIKYTKPAYFNKSDIPKNFDYLMKKPGFYLSEEKFIHLLREELQLQPNHRYFVTYIMEAADDISYCIADLEDAVEKNIFTVNELYGYLKNEWEQGMIIEKAHSSTESLFEKVVENTYHSLKNAKYRTPDTEFFMRLRVKTITELVKLASNEFIKNLANISQGSLNRALLEGKTEGAKLLSTFKKVAFKYVFTQSEVEELELKGYRVISGLLDIYSSILDMPAQDFLKLIEEDNHNQYLIETRLVHKLSNKHRFAYITAIESLKKESQSNYFDAYEFYYRVRLITDYISGMTDLYAFDEYRHLTASF
ncbi:dGTPase [Thorsellia kenyensis]|uniref:Deoxyguanosinetriphosphate triphosphohydrolase n=1 Tax=Thorsellia kenyensis TaxID=1549888 RepID=A0ABV6C8T9_9GAMM